MNITIIGTGLIGTSVGLALKASKLDATIVGTDKHFDSAVKAQKRGALDKAERRLMNAIEGAHVVIIATPVMAIKQVLELIGPELGEGTVVTDTGSTKGSVLAWAREYLPPTVHFVGGHPMAGKETTGPEAAEATLFKGRRWCVLPGKGASEDAVSVVVELVKAMGAVPYYLDVSEHDSFVAAVSHLPMLLSSALVYCTSKSASWVDISRLAATGYKDVTRLASGDPEMHRDICVTNAVGISHWIDAFIEELQRVKGIIVREDNEKELKEFFDGAWENRERWLHGAVTAGQDVPSTQGMSFGQQMGEMFMGSKLMEAQKRLFRDTDGKKGDKFKR